jgi:hypothetical protein
MQNVTKFSNFVSIVFKFRYLDKDAQYTRLNAFVKLRDQWLILPWCRRSVVGDESELASKSAPSKSSHPNFTF